MELSVETINALSEVKATILRKKYGEGQSFETVSAREAFEDILKSDRWGDDDYVEESHSLNEFLEKCSSHYSWSKTEKYSYKFLNIEKIDAVFDGIEVINRATEKVVAVNLEDLLK